MFRNDRICINIWSIELRNNPGKILEYFHYFEGKSPDKLNVTYLSDSNNTWKFGHPLKLNYNEVRKLHVLMHPFSWSEHGDSNYGNFVSLIGERNEELLYSMNSETNTFPEELLR